MSDLNESLRLSKRKSDYDPYDDVESIKDSGEYEEIGEINEDEFAPPPPPQPNLFKEWDFRHAELPEGVEFDGEQLDKISFELLSDKSTCLNIPAGTFLHLPLEFKPNGGKLINDYTITMDIKLDKLPDNDISLFVANDFAEIESEGETYIYKSGGVGVFGEPGVSESWLKPGKWSRVVITVGHGWQNRDDRKLITYVNGKKCSSVSRGIFSIGDSRFAVNPLAFYLFKSARNSLMPGNIKLKYVKFSPNYTTPEKVREENFSNRIFSYWEIEKKKEEKKMYESLSLQPLYKRPPPVWLHPAFIAEFGDAFIEGSGLDGGSPSPAIAMFSLTMSNCLQNQETYFEEFDHDERQILASVCDVFSSSREFCKKLELGSRSGAQFINFIRKHLRTKIESLKEGEKVLIPGSIGNHAIMFILEKDSKETYRFVVINTSPYGGLSYHPVTADSPPKFKYKTCIALDDIPESKILDDGFWLMLMKMTIAPTDGDSPEKLYSLILPFLLDKPFEESLALNSTDTSIDWRSPQRSSTAFFRCIQEAFHYLCRRKNLSVSKTKQFSLAVRAEMINMVDNDLHVISEISGSEKRIIRIAIEQFAYTAAKFADQDKIGLRILNKVNSIVTEIDTLANSVPCDENTNVNPPLLHLENYGDSDQYNLLPFFERLLRLEDVNGLAGSPLFIPRYVPIDFLLVPKRVTKFEEALAAIRYCDKLCTLISVQPHCVKNAAFLKVALIESVFVHIVPVPKPINPRQDFSFDDVANPDCVWSISLRYALQLDILILLQRIIEHFASSAFSIQATRSFDAVRIIVPACISAIADVVMRKRATDIPSEVSLHLMGDSQFGFRYGLSTGPFGTQSETIEVHKPELSIARTAVLDYFSAQKNFVKIFDWESNYPLVFQEGTDQWLYQVSRELAFPDPPSAMVDGSNPYIIKNYPEFACFRDIAFYWKYFLNTDLRAFPPIGNYSQFHAQLVWKNYNDSYGVEGFGNMPLFCRPKPPLSFAHRFPSTATPSFYTNPIQVNNEDDVLHIKNLPSFEDALGQQDSEFLISYLTVPYIRIPLILSFFSNDDRIHTLKNKELQAILDSILFEPGKYLPIGMNIEPTEVPTLQPTLLATPYGLLINELHRSPDVILDAFINLLNQALTLDTGTVHCNTVPIILYVLRTATRFENYLTFMIDHAKGEHESITTPLRDITLTDSVLTRLEEGLAKIRVLLRGPYHKMIEAWSYEAMKQCENKEDDRVVDENTRLVCNLFSHLLLLFRNVKFEELTTDIISTQLCSFIFLTTRHAWNMGLLTIPENEIFEVLHLQRRKLVTWVREASQFQLDEVMESIVRVVSGTGIRVPKGGEFQNNSLRKWVHIHGERSIGRFTVGSGIRQLFVDSYDIDAVPDSPNLGVEIDVQIIQLTLKSSHLQALQKQIAKKQDVRHIFGSQSMQASTVQSTEHREWVRLIGRNHDIQFWRTADPRPCVLEFDRDYIPGELEPSEEWIIPIFEPVRLSYLVQPFELQVCLPDKPLSENASVAYMIGVHPKTGGAWKEIFVFKHLRMVHIYNISSHGRRFYRSLEYTTDSRFTLRDMQPSTEARKNPWPSWERHGAGHPYAQYPDPTSVVITRGWDYPENLSGGEETFIPSRLLYGLVPCALLDTHKFWQDEEDNLRGYPHEEGPYIIYVRLRAALLDPIKDNSHGAEIYRLIKKNEVKKVEAQRKALSYLEKYHLFKDPIAVNLKLSKIMEKVAEHCEKEEQIDEILTNIASQSKIYENDYIDFDKDIQEEANKSPKVVQEKPKATSLDEEELVLLNLLYAVPPSNLSSIANCLTRVENLSYILPWAKRSSVEQKGKTTPFTIDYIQLPRLKMVFQVRKDDNGVDRLYSVDHSDLYISNSRSTLITNLIRGIPHSLILANANEELQILVPSIHPVRPPIASSPFTTELVLDRTDADWYNSLDTCYYLYPIHISLSFLFTPTLSSALYLLLLRFLNRDYDSVFRLTNSIGTDTELSSEELHIFNAIGSANNDGHPDAHSCRLKISLSTIDSPVECPWDLTKQMSKYISKISHVSMTCHIPRSEEIELCNLCITDKEDPRFDPRIYTLYEITLVKNRKYYLRAQLNKEEFTEVFTLPRSVDAAWPYTNDITALLIPGPDAWKEEVVYYARAPGVSGVMLLDVICQFWTNVEDTRGSRLRKGFLFLYEMFTGTVKTKVATFDNSHTIATYLTELLADRSEPSIFLSILILLARNKRLCELMPKYKDTRHYKGKEEIKGTGDDEDKISPLDVLLTAILPVLHQFAAELFLPPIQYSKLDDPVPIATVHQDKERDWIIPSLTDFGCDKRSLRSINSAFGIESLTLRDEEVAAFCSLPLSSISIESFVTKLSPTDLGLEEISNQLPFDITKHNQATSEVARLMIERLKNDIDLFANQANKSSIQKSLFILDKDVNQLFELFNPENNEEASSLADNILEMLLTLIELLEGLKSSDNQFVNDALTQLLSVSNEVDITDENNTTERLTFILKRACKKESFLWLEYLFGALISSRSEADLLRINPYVRKESIESIFDLIVGTILYSNRVGQINRSLSEARDLQKLLLKFKQLKSVEQTTEIKAGLILKGESLARQLSTKRTYIDKVGEELIYDPRFLVFEFTWNIVLREKQVILVREFMSSLAQGKSTVKQMIMGAGKTTVVGPLLTLMLGDGKNLVVQVVPPALLEFSRSVMRSTFSSIMYKRIYTLSFDRSSKITNAVYQKLHNSTIHRGVVICSPSTIKSIMLKFMENLDTLDDEGRPKSAELETEISHLAGVLNLFKNGVLIMDEVDLILHPLKSELNFPVGAKYDLDFNPLRWKLPIHLLDSIFYAERKRMSVGFKQSNRAVEILDQLLKVIEEGYQLRALQRNPHIVLLNPDWYHASMKPVMAQWAHLWLEAQHISGISKNDIIKYIIEGANSTVNPELAQLISEQLAPKFKKMLNLTHDWLHSFLPHVLQKIDRVSFGLLNATDYEKAIKINPHLPRTRAKLAIPFVGKDVPSESSEFAHPDVVIGLTILGYRYEGLRWSDFEDIISNLRSTLTKEIGPYEFRKSSITHEKWIIEAGGHLKGKIDYSEDVFVDLDYDDSQEVVPLRLLKRSNIEQMQKLFNLISYLPDTIHWYLENFIFPAHMRNQIIKLSACGQEIGGDMIFSKRIGFSGTPSDLLPLELGKCGYEEGSDGMMIHTMTSPDVVSYQVIGEGWSATSLLDIIAKAEPHFNALIDTGALITGMSNFQVAEYLLQHGLDWCEGVVFLDDLDRKMILVRATRRVLKLAQCGIPANKRFAFYDQVHTTGMDISHVLNATAVLTLGKDMTFRDYVQGAFRMRGIAKGQKIHLFVIPEVERLIRRELAHAEVIVSENPSITEVLRSVCGWLVINSMRMERIQFNQLCIQNITNVYKKNGYTTLIKDYQCFIDGKQRSDPHLTKAINIFREPIDFSLEAAVPEPSIFYQSLQKKIDDNKDFIYEQEELNSVNSIVQLVKDSTVDDVGERILNAEMVQEQEQEKEQQQEQEQEQEVEIEKYVDLAYSRENEEPTPWPFSSLLSVPTAEQFYTANEFHLYKRNPIEFPQYIKVSNNYFDKRWSGPRRIKNVVIVLEWIPSPPAIQPLPSRHNNLSEKQQIAFETAFNLFDIDESKDVNIKEFAQVFKSYTDIKLSEEEVISIFKDNEKTKEGAFTSEELKKLIISGKYREEEDGRYYVAVSLAEAETIRRIMHLRLEKPIIDDTEATIALRCLPANSVIIDRSWNYKEGKEYQNQAATQSLRFLNCDMYYNDPQINTLLRSLQFSVIRERIQFFTQIIGCRRRMNRKWEETPLAKIFTLPDEFHLLKQRAQSVRTREAIKAKGILLYDAFKVFDTDKNGFLSAAELYGALEWLGVRGLSPLDILEFVKTADADGDNNISYNEFIEMLRDDEDDDPESSTFKPGFLRLSTIEIQPKGEEELRLLREEILLQERRQEEEELRKESEEENKIQREIKEEEDKFYEEKGENPIVLLDSIRYDFNDYIPRGMTSRGDYAFKDDHVTNSRYLKVYKLGVLFLPIPFGPNAGGKRINRYTVTMHIRLELPPHGKLLSLIQTGKYIEEKPIVYINAEGGVGYDGCFSSLSNLFVEQEKWHIVTVTVDTTEGVMNTFIDGKPAATVRSHEIRKDGRFSLDDQICLFGSKIPEETRGADIKFFILHTYPLSLVVCFFIICFLFK